MPQMQIRYCSGYKYQLAEEHVLTVRILPGEDIQTPFIDLSTAGELVIKRGYAWDGASGPAPDTKKLMRGSLVHDALYQLMRREPNKLPRDQWRDQADLELRRVCRDDGMNRVWAWVVYQAVRRFGESAAEPASRKKVHVAP